MSGSRDLRPEISPPYDVFLDAVVWGRRVKDDGVADSPGVGADTDVLGKLANRSSGL